MPNRPPARGPATDYPWPSTTSRPWTLLSQTELGTGPRANLYRVKRWLCALLVGGVLSGFAFLLVTGQYLNDGPVVLSLTRSHGLHAGDLFVVAGWAVAMAALAILVVQSARPRSA